jgi:hypothetical protein
MVISAPFSSRIGSLTGPTVGRKKHRRSDSAAKLQKKHSKCKYRQFEYISKLIYVQIGR